MAFTFGCDPEIFLNKNGKAISAYGLIPGDKKNPFKTDGGAVQVDGMATEFNTDPIDQNDFEGFNINIIKQIKQIKAMVGSGVSLSIVPVQDFDEKTMAEAPDEAKELGCDPDYNAYTLEPNPRPEGEDVLFRTGAGHIHIGWGADIPVDNEDHIKICADFVKMLDLFVGFFMTYIDREPRRRELYGKAGAFRPKSYGVEYRTPSNVWIKNRNYRYLIHKLTNLAITRHTQGYTPEQYFVGKVFNPKKSIVDIINTGDYRTAKTFLDMVLAYDPTWKEVRTQIEKGV